MRTRPWLITLGILVGVVALVGATVDGWQEQSSKDAERERSRNDNAVHAYLSSMTHGDYTAAYSLLCTDETGTDRTSFEQIERQGPIRGFEVESSTTWSSWVDGHGRIYRVRVTRAAGSSVVEISTQGSDTVCIQYSNIRDQRPLPSLTRPTVQLSGPPTSPFR